MSRGLSKQQLRLLTQLVEHGGSARITDLMWVYEGEDPDPGRNHSQLSRTKRALFPLRKRGLITTQVEIDTMEGKPRSFMDGPSGFCTRYRTIVRITDQGRAIAPPPVPLSPEQEERMRAVAERINARLANTPSA